MSSENTVEFQEAPPRRFALCLSGGGLRATFFHLGVVEALREANLLSQVTHIFSVSGGSIFAAHLVLKWDLYTGSGGGYQIVKDEILRLARRDIRGRIVRRWILGCIFPPCWPFYYYFQRQNSLLREYARIFGQNGLFDLAASGQRKKPDLHILATSLTTGSPCSFSSAGFTIQKDDELHTHPKRTIPISLAVAASSAFPPLFPPITVSREMLGMPEKEHPYPYERLTDGGVFDNLGIEQFATLAEDKGDLPDDVILSDAGAYFDWKTSMGFTGIISRNVRATEILMKRVGDQSISTAKNKIGLNLLYSGIVVDARQPKELHNELAIEMQQPLAEVRTDLDLFSDLEADTLVRHGYGVCRTQLIKMRLLERPPESAFDRISRVNSWIAAPTSTIARAEDLLKKSSKRTHGLFNPLDPVSYLMWGWVALVIVGLPLFLVARDARLATNLATEQMLRSETQSALAGAASNLRASQSREEEATRQLDSLRLRLKALQDELELERGSRALTSYLDELSQHLRSNGIDRITASELLVRSEPNIVTVGPREMLSSTELPSRELWENMIPTAKALQEFLARSGVAVEIISTYRLSGYPTHGKFSAIDFLLKGQAPPESWMGILQQLLNEHLIDEMETQSTQGGQWVHLGRKTK